MTTAYEEQLYLEVAKEIIKQRGECEGINCPDCPFDAIPIEVTGGCDTTKILEMAEEYVRGEVPREQMKKAGCSWSEDCDTCIFCEWGVCKAQSTEELSEAVDHPSHYGGKENPYEAIKIIEALGLGEDFCLGNVIKYCTRAGKKENELEDLKKAAWYLNRLIAQKESK